MVQGTHPRPWLGGYCNLEGLSLRMGRTCPEGIRKKRVTALPRLGWSSLVDLASVTIPNKSRNTSQVALLVPLRLQAVLVCTYVDSRVGPYVVSCVGLFVCSCLDTYVVSFMDTYIDSSLDLYVDSRVGTYIVS